MIVSVFVLLVSSCRNPDVKLNPLYCHLVAIVYTAILTRRG